MVLNYPRFDFWVVGINYRRRSGGARAISCLLSPYTCTLQAGLHEYSALEHNKKYIQPKSTSDTLIKKILFVCTTVCEVATDV